MLCSYQLKIIILGTQKLMDYRHHLPPQMARQPPQLSNNSSSSSSRSSLNSNMAPPPSGFWSGEAPNMQQTFKLPSDDELRCKGTEYLLKLIRKYEMDYYKLTMNHNDLQHNFMVCFLILRYWKQLIRFFCRTIKNLIQYCLIEF